MKNCNRIHFRAPWYLGTAGSLQKLAVRMRIDFRILADLLEAVDPNGLGLPHNLT